MSVQPVAGSRFRVVGSGYTLFSFAGQKVMFVDGITERPPAGVAAVEEIQPLDALRPIEIAFPRAVTHGEINLTIREEWDNEVWQRLSGYGGAIINDLADLFTRSSAIGPITCTKLILPPPPHKSRTVYYHNCVITDAQFGDAQIAINSMTQGKSVTIWYTAQTRKGS